MDNAKVEEIIQKRLMTVCIFPIAELEKYFGHLWNHDEEDESKLTKKEIYYDQLYEKFRKSVLDNGNNQIRKAIQDIRRTLDENE